MARRLPIAPLPRFLAPAVVSVVLFPPVTAGAQSIVAHRGASHDAPENTLAAFRLAWTRGADAIEGDFYLTRDHRIVCIHDESTKRTAGVDRRVQEATLDELRQLDVGSWKSPAYRGERIPTLEEVLQTVPACKRILIEIKCGPEIVPYLSRVLQKSRLSPAQTTVIAFDADVVKAVREQIPSIEAYWLVYFKKDEQTGTWSPSLESILDTLSTCRAHGLDMHANFEVVDRPFLDAIRQQGYQVHLWTIDDPDDARRARQLGVDSITTNRPAKLKEILQQSPSGVAAGAPSDSGRRRRFLRQRRLRRRAARKH